MCVLAAGLNGRTEGSRRELIPKQYNHERGIRNWIPRGSYKMTEV